MLRLMARGRLKFANGSARVGKDACLTQLFCQAGRPNDVGHIGIQACIPDRDTHSGKAMVVLFQHLQRRVFDVEDPG